MSNNNVSELFDIKKSYAYAIIRFSGTTIIPEEITNLLEVAPTVTQNIGDSLKTISKSASWASWAYRTTERETEDTSCQLEELVSIFKGKTSTITYIKNKYTDCELTIYIVLNNHQNTLPALTVLPEQIAFLSCIGVGLYFDIYHYPETEQK